MKTKKKTGHTPRPWNVESDSADYNAHLVAADPELMVALIETKEALAKSNTAHCGREYAIAMNAAWAAISKAGGI